MANRIHLYNSLSVVLKKTTEDAYVMPTIQMDSISICCFPQTPAQLPPPLGKQQLAGQYFTRAFFSIKKTYEKEDFRGVSILLVVYVGSLLPPSRGVVHLSVGMIINQHTALNKITHKLQADSSKFDLSIGDGTNGTVTKNLTAFLLCLFVNKYSTLRKCLYYTYN